MAWDWDKTKTPRLSIIKIGNETFYVKDAEARAAIDSITATVGGVMHWRGISTTDPTTGTVTIGGEVLTPESGDVVGYNSLSSGTQLEYAYNGSTWQEFGSTGTLKALAFKDSATGSFVPLGEITSSTFTGNELTSTGTFTPAGTVSAEFTGDTLTSTGNFTPEGSVSVSASDAVIGDTANYTPSGTVSGSFVGAQMTSTGTFTPAGSISAPTVTPTTGSVAEVDQINTVVSEIQNAVKASANSATETLTLTTLEASDITKIAAITTKSATVLTDVDVAAPTFIGAEGNVSVSGTTTGSLNGLSFSGNGAVINATFTGTQGNVSVSGTPEGTVSADFTGTQGNVSVAGTPTGSISVVWEGQDTSVTVS